MGPISFLDLHAEYVELKAEIDSAVAGVLAKSQFILGPEVEALEAEFGAYCEAAHAIGVNSGTSALHLALLALGVGPGDEVITVPFTFYATVAAIHYTGATPVFVDIDERTFNLDPRLLERAITPRTKAILLVHLYGQPADMESILPIARKYGVPVIEDAAQAHGAEWQGRRVGAIGDIGCFSFYPTKNLGAPGEGGMVVTNDSTYASLVRKLRDWGQDRKYHPTLRGYNYRLQGIQAAVLRVKLRRLEAWTEARRANAARYDDVLSGSGLQLPATLPGVRHVYHLYTVRCDARDELQRQLTDIGIPTAIHYPTPIHLLPAYSDVRFRRGDFPVSEACSRTVLSLPVHPYVTAEQHEKICQGVREAAGRLVTCPR